MTACSPTHHCKVWVRISLGIKQFGPCDTVSAASHSPLVARHAPALSTYVSPAPSRRPPCAFAARHPRSSLDRHLPLRSQVDLPVAPQNHRPRLKHRPHRIGRYQKRKTPLLYVARVAHRPCPSPLEVWTSSRFGRFTTGLSFAQVPSTPLLFLFCFRRSVLHFPNFPICIRSYFRARGLVSHPHRLRDRRRARDRHSVKIPGFGLHIRRRATCRR